MATSDRSAKTEKPTPKRKKEAREKGQIARSPDLTAWTAMLVTAQLLKFTMHQAAKTFSDMLEGMAKTVASPDLGTATKFAADSAKSAIIVIAPFLLALMGIAIVVGVSQVGLKPSMKRLKPDFSRLNPFKGIKRLFSPQSYWEVAKSVLKVVVLVAVAWPAMKGATSVFTSGDGSSINGLAALTATTGLTIMRNVSVAGLAIAAVDYIVQRRRVMKDISMTKQEVKEEYKQSEGNPQIRRAIRQKQIAISRNRMIGLVSDADVIVVNPTHYAVALKYESTKGAPQVVAKGAGVIAKRIREEGEKHNVPIVHEPVLTRALYAACNLGSLIPVEMYEAVAQLLAFVFSLRQKGHATGYHEMPAAARVLKNPVRS